MLGVYSMSMAMKKIGEPYKALDVNFFLTHSLSFNMRKIVS